MHQLESHKEPTAQELEMEAQELRILSGFAVTIEQARDRVADSRGWVNWAHMVACKLKRGAA